MSKELKYRVICPLCGKPFDRRNGKLSPDGKVVCHECYEHFGFATYIYGLPMKATMQIRQISSLRLMSLKRNSILNLYLRIGRNATSCRCIWMTIAFLRGMRKVEWH